MPSGLDTTLDRVDDADRIVGEVRRRDALHEGANFRTAHVFLGDAGELLLQRVGERGTRHPGLWGASVAAYVSQGESYEAAAHRRLGEELGVDVPLRRVAKIVVPDERSRKFVALFGGPAVPVSIREPDHIAELEMWQVRDIAVTLQQRPETFTPTFASLFAVWRTLT